MFRQILNDKIGNLLIYLADNIRDLSLTKALKLLYIIDETSMNESGVPVTWLEYKAWKLGPVAPEIWDEVKNGVTCSDSKLVGEYIKIEKKLDNDLNESLYIVSNAEFNDGEFSDYEMELIDKIILEFGKKTGNELVKHLHRKGTLWDIEVKKHSLDFELQRGTSNVAIQLTEKIKDNPLKKLVYMSAFDSLSFECDVLSK